MERKQLAKRGAKKTSDGSYSYAPLLRCAYNDLSGIIQVWADSCTQMAVYEHEADEKVKTTHVHMIMLGCIYKTPEALKRAYYKMFPEFDTSKGNGFWSWVNEEWDVPDINFITYMSKGKLAPKFVKNIPAEVIEELREKWSEPTPKPLTQTVLNTKESKLTNHKIMLKVVQTILSQPEHADKNEKQRKELLENLDDRLWFKFIRKVLIQESQVKGLYKVMDIYDSCIMYYSKNTFVDNCLQVLEKRRR